MNGYAPRPGIIDLMTFFVGQGNLRRQEALEELRRKFSEDLAKRHFTEQQRQRGWYENFMEQQAEREGQERAAKFLQPDVMESGGGIYSVQPQKPWGVAAEVLTKTGRTIPWLPPRQPQLTTLKEPMGKTPSYEQYQTDTEYGYFDPATGKRTPQGKVTPKPKSGITPGAILNAALRMSTSNQETISTDPRTGAVTFQKGQAAPDTSAITRNFDYLSRLFSEEEPQQAGDGYDAIRQQLRAEGFSEEQIEQAIEEEIAAGR